MHAVPESERPEPGIPARSERGPSGPAAQPPRAEDWDRIDAVLVDLGGVVYLPDHDRMRSALGRLGIDAAHDDLDRAHYAGVAATDDFTSDHSVWHAYNLAYARVHGVPDEHLDRARSVLLEEFERGDVWTREIAGTREALATLAARGIAIAVVSNADGTVEAQLRRDGICQVGPGPGVSVGAVLDSRVVGVAKPDPAIFRLALDTLGVEPQHAVHVGDTPAADVAGARAADVHPVLIDPYDHHPDADVVRIRHLRELVPLVGEPTSTSASIGFVP